MGAQQSSIASPYGVSILGWPRQRYCPAVPLQHTKKHSRTQPLQGPSNRAFRLQPYQSAPAQSFAHHVHPYCIPEPDNCH